MGGLRSPFLLSRETSAALPDDLIAESESPSVAAVVVLSHGFRSKEGLEETGKSHVSAARPLKPNRAPSLRLSMGVHLAGCHHKRRGQDETVGTLKA